jgi:hypothetical protein
LTQRARQKKVALINKMAKRDSVCAKMGFSKSEKNGPAKKRGAAQSRLSISYFSLAADYIKDEGQA